MMAEGRASDVPQPFASRTLHTDLARLLAPLGGGRTDDGFRLLGMISLVLLTSSVSLILARALRRSWAVMPLLMIPFLLRLFGEYHLPDLLHGALLGLFLLVLSSFAWASLPVLVLLLLSRETTILLSLVLFLLAWRHNRRGWALAVLGISVLGVLNTWFLGETGAGNVHGLGSALYLVLKFPFNLLRNVFGIEIWVNSLDPCRPLHVWTLPAWLSTPAVQQVGICAWSGMRPLHLLTYWLTTFGLLPVLAGAYWIRWRGEIFRRLPWWAGAALGYGVLAFLLAPAMGAAIHWLVGYGWPAFWLAVPLLLCSGTTWGNRQRFLLVVCHLAVAWIPALAGTLISDPVAARLAILVASFPSTPWHCGNWYTGRPLSIWPRDAGRTILLVVDGTGRCGGRATWDGMNWSALGEGLNSYVYAMIEHDDRLVAGGNFTEADGISVEHIARWNGTDASGRLVSPGVYFLRVVAGEGEQRAKLVRMSRWEELIITRTPSGQSTA